MKPLAAAASCLLAALLVSTSHAHPDTPAVPSRTSTGSGLDDLIPSATPFPGIHYGFHKLDLRQNLGVDPDAGADPGQVSPVTTYSIISQVGATGLAETYTYTQTFAPVLDQFPRARRGAIGYGTLHSKREVKAQPTPSVNTGYIAQPLVIAMETVLITRHLRRVTEIIIVETVSAAATGVSSNGTMSRPYTVNGTLPTGYPLNGSLPMNGTTRGVNGTLPISLASAGTGYGQYNATMGPRHPT